jgi:hypothetical protein
MLGALLSRYQPQRHALNPVQRYQPLAAALTARISGSMSRHRLPRGDCPTARQLPSSRRDKGFRQFLRAIKASAIISSLLLLRLFAPRGGGVWLFSHARA